LAASATVCGADGAAINVDLEGAAVVVLVGAELERKAAVLLRLGLRNQ